MKEEYISKTLLLETINTDIAMPHNERCAQLLEAILNAPVEDVVKIENSKWRPYYYISKADPPIGGKWQDGWVCSVCQKHSTTRKEVCDGCNTKMWTVNVL